MDIYMYIANLKCIWSRVKLERGLIAAEIHGFQLVERAVTIRCCTAN